jgi:hypothetical protein
MNDIELKLGKLESIFKEANAPVLQFLNPGLQDEEIITFFSKTNIPIHPDLLSLYRWHNGVVSIYGRVTNLIALLPLGAFPNLNEMADLRNDFISYDYFEVENRHEYIPLLSGGEDIMYLLRISTGEIYYSSPRIQIYCEPEFHSLSSMLDFILRCYQENILRMHPIDGLIVDERYWKLSDDYRT